MFTFKLSNSKFNKYENCIWKITIKHVFQLDLEVYNYKNMFQLICLYLNIYVIIPY